MTSKKIMELKAEAEARRIIKELEKTGKATMYCSFKKISDLELVGEELMFGISQKILNSLTNEEGIFVDTTINEIKRWMSKQYASEGEEYKVYTKRE